jgi:hypothetical protein
MRDSMYDEYGKSSYDGTYEAWLIAKLKKTQAKLEEANEDASALNIVAKDALLNCKCVMPDSYRAVINNHRARIAKEGKG